MQDSIIPCSKRHTIRLMIAASKQPSPFWLVQSFTASHLSLPSRLLLKQVTDELRGEGHAVSRSRYLHSTPGPTH